MAVLKWDVAQRIYCGVSLVQTLAVCTTAFVYLATLFTVEANNIKCLAESEE